MADEQQSQAKYQQHYKNSSKDTSTMRSKRLEATIELRKSKKEDQMFKRRNIDVNATSPLKEPNSPASPDIDQYASLEDIIHHMQSDDGKKVLRATQAARKILSQEKNPPIATLIGHGVVPLCVRFLESNLHELQFEAAWALTNIASGTSEQTLAVVKADAVPKFVNLLQSTTTVVAEQSVWALGNIAGDGPVTRDIVLKYGAAESILKLLEQPQPISFLRNIVWLMSNLCRNKNPGPPFDKVQMMLPALSKLLQHEDVQILTDAAWAISYVTDDESDRIEAVIQAGCVPSLCRLLGLNENAVIVPALRSVGNIVTGSDTQTDAALNAGVLNHMKKLLNNQRSNIVKEAAWTISNITAGNPRQVQAVIDAGIFEEIYNVMENGDFRAQKEAAWVVTNTTSSGTPDQITRLMQRVLKPYCNLLKSKDARTILVVLNGINNLFQLAEKMSQTDDFARVIEENGALDILEKLQDHENDDIYKASIHLIEKYFHGDEENELAPQNTGNGVLEFNANPNNQPDGGFNF